MANTRSSRRQRRRGRARATDSTSAAGVCCITASVPSHESADRDLGIGRHCGGLYLTTMNTNHTRKAVSALIAGAAAPALLFLGAGSAQALPDVGERGAAAILDDLPTPRTCPSCVGFDPQPDPPGYPDPGSVVRSGVPNQLPSIKEFDPQPDPPSAAN